MGFDLSRRVGLFVAHGVGAGIVFEKQGAGGHVPVRIFGSPYAAKLWVDSHYEDVEWEPPDRATASVGRLSEPARPSPIPGESRAWEHRPLTYESRTSAPAFPSWWPARTAP
jgi:hypothetical protein